MSHVAIPRITTCKYTVFFEKRCNIKGKKCKLFAPQIAFLINLQFLA